MPSTPGSPLLAALKLQQLQQQQKEAGKAIAEILRLLLRPWGLPHTLRALGPELKQADAKLVADFLFAHRLVTLDKYIQVGCSWRWWWGGCGRGRDGVGWAGGSRQTSSSTVDACCMLQACVQQPG